MLIGGTNGKGEAAKRIESGLRALGWKTFLFTSPHLVRVEERFRFDGRQVSRRRLDEAHLRCLSACPGGEADAGPLTPFEWLTLVGLVLARDEASTARLLEVGLGGRLDATNCVDPAVSVLTRIAHDHTDFLGSSLEAIAAEKAGILRPGAGVVLGRQAASWVRHQGACVEGEHFELAGEIGGAIRYRGLGGEVSLGPVPESPGGGHPGYLAVALAAVELFAEPSSGDLARAARAAACARWPGRFEIVRAEPPLVLDGAHNPDGSAWLARRLEERFGTAKFDLVFAAKPSKDVRGMIAALAPRVRRVHVVRDRSGWLSPPEEIAPAVRAVFDGEVLLPGAPAFEVVSGIEGPCVAAGSLFLCGELMDELGLGAGLEVLE